MAEPIQDAAPQFEQLYEELEAISRKLEDGGLLLEESIGLYERGGALVEQLRAILDSAEGRIRETRRRLDGRREVPDPNP